MSKPEPRSSLRSAAQILHKPSHLESLPGELLEAIWDDLCAGEPFIISHPLSWTLRPYVTREQYRHIELDYSHFLLLCRTVCDSPHFAPLIKSFMLVPKLFSQDFQIQHDELVFNFFKSVSLESFESLEHHPLLQKRVVCAKYAIHCNKSLKSLSLYFPRSDYGEDDQLCRQSRYLSHIRSLNSLRLIMGDSEEGDFDERSKDHFEEEDRLELERNGLYISYYNTVADVEIDGEYDSDDLAEFAERCRGVTQLTLSMSDDAQFDTNISSVLGALNPFLLRQLSIGTPDWMDDELEINPADFTPFINLVTLRLPTLNFNAELITLLPNFPNLTEIGTFIDGNDGPAVPNILALFNPQTRPPALRTFDFAPSLWVVSNEQCIAIDEYDPADQGVALPIWQSEWTVDGAREILALGDQQGLELVGRKVWEKAIAMTEDYLAAGGVLSDAEAEDG